MVYVLLAEGFEEVEAIALWTFCAAEAVRSGRSA